MTSGNITIEDVAAAAGVSRQTVSRVINRQPNVRDSVRERVQTAIAELGYVPNLAARRMGGARSYLILAAFEQGTVGRTGGRLPLDEMLMAGLKACAKAGYHLLFEKLDAESSQQNSSAAQQIERALTSLKPDGVVLCPSLEENVSVRNALSKRAVATDYLGQRSEFGRMVPGLDDSAFGEEAAEHLLARGHRQIGFISGLHNALRSRRRLEGYRRALVKVGSRVHGHFISDVPMEFEQTVQLAKTWLLPTIRPTAIIAETEETGLAVLRATRHLNIAVPSDLSVLVLDDSPSLAHSEPPLTVLHQAYATHFAAACERLMRAATKGRDDSVGQDDGNRLIERASVTSAPRNT